MTSQTWMLNGRHYTKSQLDEYRKNLKSFRNRKTEEKQVDYELMDFLKLKKLASEKGMQTDRKTKKVDVMNFLNSNQ